jgi:hypothetical protein
VKELRNRQKFTKPSVVVQLVYLWRKENIKYD